MIFTAAIGERVKGSRANGSKKSIKNALSVNEPPRRSISPHNVLHH
jgi:hypothetical protein